MASKKEREAKQRELLGANFDDIMGTKATILRDWKEPMLSSKIDEDNIRQLSFPYIISPKFDGIRAVRHSKGTLSRANKLIPNLFIQKTIDEITAAMPLDKDGINLVHGLDGELIVSSPTALDVFQRSTSGVMSVHGEPDFTWWVFDRYDRWEGGTSTGQPRGRYFPGLQYAERLEQVRHLVKTINHPRLKVIDHTLYSQPTSLEALSQWALDQGYEGLMLNSPTALYRCGRPSFKMNILHKYKPLEDFEAMIVDVYEQMANGNEQYENERGRSQRSSAASGKRGKGTLGGFVMRLPDGTEFNCGIGPGLTEALRQHIWDNPKEYVNKLAKCRKQKMGEKDKPRQPRFLGLRSEIDLSPKKGKR